MGDSKFHKPYEDDYDWTGLGPDPTSEDFGGNTFDADAIGDSGTAIHSGYLKSDVNEPNQARTTMAEIITGQKG